ncbi:MAG: hypothetical protein MUE70_08830 [Desulfobacterales bacterium]|jgi:hypothetical protein|nr:hypothetical protein [Desulfobacterales bacterium]
MKKIIFYAFLSVILLPPLCASAEGWTPVQVALWTPAQIFPENKDVYGFRWSILYGKNQNLSGIDFGGYNAVEGTLKGLQFGMFNFSKDARGVGFGLFNYSFALEGIHIGGVNYTEVDSSGVQTGIILNNSGPVRGLQILGGIIGNIAADVVGCQLAAATPIFSFNYAESIDGLQVSAFGFNYAAGTVNGVQIAPWNIAREVRGVQVGLFNFCDKMYGVQVGLLNSITRQKPPFMPIFNVGF